MKIMNIILIKIIINYMMMKILINIIYHIKITKIFIKIMNLQKNQLKAYMILTKKIFQEKLFRNQLQLLIKIQKIKQTFLKIIKIIIKI
jgi:hypothetical protein